MRLHVAASTAVVTPVMGMLSTFVSSGSPLGVDVQAGEIGQHGHEVVVGRRHTGAAHTPPGFRERDRRRRPAEERGRGRVEVQRLVRTLEYRRGIDDAVGVAQVDVEVQRSSVRPGAIPEERPGSRDPRLGVDVTDPDAPRRIPEVRIMGEGGHRRIRDVGVERVGHHLPPFGSGVERGQVLRGRTRHRGERKDDAADQAREERVESNAHGSFSGRPMRAPVDCGRTASSSAPSLPSSAVGASSPRSYLPYRTKR